MLPAGSIVRALYHKLIEIINKPLFLHIVGYLYYWQMGFNSVFKGLNLSPPITNGSERTLID